MVAYSFYARFVSCRPSKSAARFVFHDQFPRTLAFSNPTLIQRQSFQFLSAGFSLGYPFCFLTTIRAHPERVIWKGRLCSQLLCVPDRPFSPPSRPSDQCLNFFTRLIRRVFGNLNSLAVITHGAKLSEPSLIEAVGFRRFLENLSCGFQKVQFTVNPFCRRWQSIFFPEGHKQEDASIRLDTATSILLSASVPLGSAA